MGLDMYLRATKHIWGSDWAPEQDKTLYAHVVEACGMEQYRDKDTPILQVELGVAYWRKANQIHAWFVENVQNGVDDCGDYYVSREQLKQLRDLAARVLDSLALEPGKVKVSSTVKDGKWEDQYEDGQVATNTELAEKLLPTQEGFFFGGTNYDEFYAQDLRDTVSQLDRVLSMPGGWDFEYHSSW